MSGSRPAALRLPADLASRIDQAEVARLLGYPDRRLPEGRARERAGQARSWYRQNGDAWALARSIRVAGIGDGEIELAEAESLSSRLLADRLRKGDAEAIMIAAVSAGSTVDVRSAALWKEDRPDEAYFLDRFAAAVTEYLAGWIGDHLRAELARGDRGLLPSYSPGYHGWDLEQQGRLARSLIGAESSAPPFFEVMDSGMITPRNSLLAVFGVTPRPDLAAAAWDRQPCSWCALTACGFRRVRLASPRGQG